MGLELTFWAWHCLVLGDGVGRGRVCLLVITRFSLAYLAIFELKSLSEIIIYLILNYGGQNFFESNYQNFCFLMAKLTQSPHIKLSFLICLEIHRLTLPQHLSKSIFLSVLLWHHLQAYFLSLKPSANHFITRCVSYYVKLLTSF